MHVAYPGVAALAQSALGSLTTRVFAPPAASAGGVGRPPVPERAVILRGAPILTMDESAPVVEALAIRGSTILEVGSLTEMKRHYTTSTEIVDLEGCAVLPGFVEPHAHVLGTALADDLGPTRPLAEGERLPASAGEPRADADALVEAIGATLEAFARRGCTTVYDTAIGLRAGAAEHELLGALARAPDAPVRVRGALVPELVDELGVAPGEGDERYDVVGVAYWADGSFRDRAAAVSEPYLEGGRGALAHGEQELREAMRARHCAGWQVVAHACGDRAIEQVLSCYEAILAEESPTPARHRIEHFTLAREDHVARVAQLGLGVSHAINQLYFCGARLRDELLGPERAAHAHALRRELEHGVLCACHSDSPLSPVDPCLTLRTATTRLMHGSEDVLGPFQQLTLAQALRTVTVTPAAHVGLEGRVGALRPGMLADLVVLDRDPRATAPERLGEIRVLETWLGGRRQRWA